MQYQRALTGQGDITDQKDGVSGFVTDIVFSSEQADWRVLEIDTDQDHELLIITGNMPDVEVGEHLDCKGGFQEHPRYGRQFQVKSYERSLPNDKETMERYLGSGMIVGIGPKLASRIVETFGDDTFTILETQPERLEEIKGISLKKACDIGEQFAQKAESRTVMIYLTKLGLTPGMAMNIYKTFGAKTISTVEANPYHLAEKVSGIGFKKADEIARMAGLAEDAPARLKAAASYVLTDASMNGSTYLPRPDLLQRMFDLLQVDYQELENAVDQAEAGGVLIEKDGCVYLKHLALAERMAARRLVELDQFFSGPDHRAKEEPASLSGSHFKKDLEQSQQRLGLTLSDEQRSAVEMALTSGVSIITGGPGTGKTTIIKVLLDLLEQEGRKCLLAAPTGKAAKRMEETTGREARTIHRLLGASGAGEDGQTLEFQQDQDHPLEADAVIVDEMSMVDISLMASLTEAVPDGCRLIMLGDKDQLPSVGPGSVLKDMVDCDLLPVAKLTRIYRQDLDSGITANAHRINRGEAPVLENSRADGDFYFIPMDPAAGLKNQLTLTDLVRSRLPRFTHAKSMDIQVLTPQKKGDMGVIALNKVLQQALNPASKAKEEIESGQYVFRVGDKVMQTRNNYELEWNVRNKYSLVIGSGKGVYNGDCGRILRIDHEGVLVRFDQDHDVLYDLPSLRQLTLAYAMTIHKSQGSESPVVVIALCGVSPVLRYRSILYTAITRARKCAVIVGEWQTVLQMTANNRQETRYSGLCRALIDQWKLVSGQQNNCSQSNCTPGRGLEDKEPDLMSSLPAPGPYKRPSIDQIARDMQEETDMDGFEEEEDPI